MRGFISLIKTVLVQTTRRYTCTLKWKLSFRWWFCWVLTEFNLILSNLLLHNLSLPVSNTFIWIYKAMCVVSWRRQTTRSSRSKRMTKNQGTSVVLLLVDTVLQVPWLFQISHRPLTAHMTLLRPALRILPVELVVALLLTDLPAAPLLMALPAAVALLPIMDNHHRPLQAQLLWLNRLPIRPKRPRMPRPEV